MTQIKYLLIITTEKELSVKFPQAVHLTYLLATVYFGDVFKDLPVSQATSLLRYLCDQICLNLSHSPFLASCFESICIFFFFFIIRSSFKVVLFNTVCLKKVNMKIDHINIHKILKQMHISKTSCWSLQEI